MWLERKMLRCTEAVESVQQDWKDRVCCIEIGGRVQSNN